MKNNIGHNSIDKNTAELLKRYIDGIEAFEEQKKDLSESIKEIFDEAKSAGFDVKTIRSVLKIRKQPAEKVDEAQYLIDTYMKALEELPLFKQGE